MLKVFVLVSVLVGMVVALGEEKKSIPGGHNAVDVNSENVTAFVEKALAKHNAASNELNEFVLVKVLSATSQVVAGTNHVIKVELGLTDCKKGAVCAEKKVQSTKQYEITVFSQPWTNTEDIKIKEL